MSSASSSFYGLILAVVAIAVIVLLVRVIRKRLKNRQGYILCAVCGGVALAFGGIGYFVADGKLSDPAFLWDYYGDSQYEFMIDLRNIGHYAMIVGVLLIAVGVVLYAVNAGKRSAGADHASPSVERKPVARPKKKAERYCANCHQPLTTEGKFCPHCGSQLVPAERRCVCGVLLDENARFCPECGTKYEQ